MSTEEKIARNYYLDERLVKKFKKQSKKLGKPYERAFNEAIKLWLEKNHKRSDSSEG